MSVSSPYAVWRRAFQSGLGKTEFPGYLSRALGPGQYYRRWTLERAGLRRGMTVLDVATGTGRVAREAVRIVHPSRVVIGLHPSRGMLARLYVREP